ncbi:MAG: sigma-70 family RNA polymerase sigma factor [Deltaproteobacteria bacterium]|nr:sigma-70 family RNA polymerase sigma factor [Deltaproteobacteria bacterium]
MLAQPHDKPKPSASVTAPPANFDEAYTQGFAYVWSTLRRMGVREASLPDVTHDVFIVVFRRWNDFDSARPLRPWLFGIAYRVASDHFALAHQRRERLDADVATDHVAHEPSPERALESAQRRAMVHEALQEIPMEQRAVLIAFDLEEQPMNEIALAMEVPVKTGYSRLRLAREALVGALDRALRRRGER